VSVGSSRQPARVAPTRVLAALLVPAALAVCSAVLVWSASTPIGAVRAPGPAPVDALLALGAAVACAGLLGLAALGATLSLAAMLTGPVAGRIGRLAQALTPGVVRAAVGLAVGVTVVGGPVCGPALGLVASPLGTSVTTAVAGDPPAERSGATPTLPPGWSPDRPATTSASPRTPAVQVVTSKPPVVVLPGDTLWSIAARHLGHSASDAQVAAEWPRWHAANRATIGRNPDLILPGQRLHSPDSPPPTDPPAHRS
jgi:hypothetical protein